MAIEGVDLHQLVQDIRVVGPQGGGLQEGFQGGTGILQFFALQTTHAAEILEPFVGGEVSCEQPAKLLDESSRIGRTATLDPGVGLGQRLPGHRQAGRQFQRLHQGLGGGLRVAQGKLSLAETEQVIRPFSHRQAIACLGQQTRHGQAHVLPPLLAQG